MAMAARSTPSRPWKIAIVGHSHVYRMDASAVNGNNFHLSNVETAFFSRGGLRVPNLFGADILQPLMAFEPDTTSERLQETCFPYQGIDYRTHFSPEGPCIIRVSN